MNKVTVQVDTGFFCPGCGKKLRKRWDESVNKGKTAFLMCGIVPTLERSYLSDQRPCPLANVKYVLPTIDLEVIETT